MQMKSHQRRDFKMGNQYPLVYAKWILSTQLLPCRRERHIWISERLLRLKGLVMFRSVRMAPEMSKIAPNLLRK